ncbi:pseudouridine synthase [Melittangium boletus]|uniref:Pseudouridine synthase n=1 Tax=Melittangium boletus DSM 14713 TaxID=1294270 RepID=A0A250ISP1_9BACT|nr:pseudouridine synthase [Melittangium boletus]ATB33956.1 ribosomal large subunit pseudouridine synthase B [Melittangium boletus DSM 14713]
MAERLQKYLARAGVASRRHAEELITSGRVTVNNEKVTELGSKVEPGDLVSVDGSLVTPPEQSSYYLLYKPVGVVTTLSDPQGRPTVANYLEETGKRLFPVGRLDYDAEGALLVTDDGALAHKLTHPSFQVPRTYLAKVKGTPDAATLDKMRGGVRLEDGMATPVSVEVFERAERNTWLTIVVAEGRPHLIKRLCAAVGSPVVRLYRPSYGGVSVDGMRPGELRPLSDNQVRLLQDVADGKTSPTERELKLPPRRHGRSVPGFESDDDDDIETEQVPALAPSRAARKPARGASPDRSSGKPERPVRSAAGRPERRGEAGPRGAGGARPAFRSATGGRAERNTWTPREDDQNEVETVEESEAVTERAARPVRKTFGADRSERPARKTFGADRDERPARKSFGADRSERPARKTFGADRDERPARKPFGAGRDERPARKPFGAGRDERPARKTFGADRDERPARKPFGAGRDERPARKSFGADRSERPARKTFGADRDERPARKPFGADRDERPARKPFGAGRDERPARKTFGADRDERPARKTFGADRDERPARKPFGAGRDERPARKSFGGERAERPARKSFGGERAERPARKSFGADRGERSAKSESPSFGAGPSAERRVSTPSPRTERREWAPRGGAGAPKGRGGPRKGR